MVFQNVYSFWTCLLKRSLDCMFIVVLSDVFRMICLCVCVVFSVVFFFVCVLFVWRFFSRCYLSFHIFPRVFNVNWVGQIKVEGPEAFYYNKM